VLTKILVGLAAVAVIGLIVGGVIVFGQSNSDSSSDGGNQPTPAASQAPAGKLESTDLTVGTGAEAVAGKSVSVNYRGTLTNGTEFDSSYSRNEPFTFTLGSGQVIKGWDQGVAGMKVGGKRKLVIPADLAYGDRENGKIPAGSTLVFEIELLDVK
jgi:FKBP-type peptidyl-prolyl cis-trans isomerase